MEVAFVPYYNRLFKLFLKNWPFFITMVISAFIATCVLESPLLCIFLFLYTIANILIIRWEALHYVSKVQIKEAVLIIEYFRKDIKQPDILIDYPFYTITYFTISTKGFLIGKHVKITNKNRKESIRIFEVGNWNSTLFESLFDERIGIEVEKRNAN